MLPHLIDVSVRSLLFAGAAAIILWMLRGRRTAALQHAVWTLVVCGMLALFAFGQSLPRLPLRVLDRPAAAHTPAPAPTQPELVPEITYTAPRIPPAPRRAIDWRTIAVCAYAAIALAFLSQFATGIFLARRLVASARSAFVGQAIRLPVAESPRITVPLTVGCLRPRILLPTGWRTWDPTKLDTVLTHESAHIRRRDTLISALAGLNRCLFWFHPLAWILERKLALLSEQACDESCVAALGDRRRYAHLLLEMAAVVDASQGRLRYHALTMAARSHIRQRIDSLLQEGRTFSRGLTRTGWVAIALCGIPVVWGAAAVDLDRQPPLLSLSIPRWKAPAPPVLLAQAQTQTPPVQPPAATRPAFDAASIRPCAPGDSGGKNGGRGSGGGRGTGTSPGRFWVTCMSVFELLDISLLGANDDPLLFSDAMGPDPTRVRGGPAWLYSELYTIEAQTDDPVANGPTVGPTPAGKAMRGPMLRTLLEDRFHLKLHRAVEEVPMYALTVAKGGLKIKPMEDGGCIPRDATKGVRVSEMFPPGQKPLCIGHLGSEGPNWTIDGAGQPMSQLASALSATTDRHVIDKTGLTAVFSFHLAYAHDQSTPGHFPADLPMPFPPTDTPGGPSVFTAVEQLGLKLVPDKGPRAYLAIDSAERPSGN